MVSRKLNKNISKFFITQHFEEILKRYISIFLVYFLYFLLKLQPLQDEQEPEGEDLVDSEEYEEDEEEERLRKKRKKDSRYGGFIIDEAEVIVYLFITKFAILLTKCHV